MSALNEVFRSKDCPKGQKAVRLLDQQNIPHEDHVFSSRQDERRFKEKHGVKTTPQIFFGDQRVGGYSDLKKTLGKSLETDSSETQTSYQPVIALFGVAAMLTLVTEPSLMEFMGFALVLLSLQKLMDIKGFQEGFIKYDLLTQRLPLYGQVYPFLELTIGLAFLQSIAPVTTGIVSTLVGVAGGVSIVKAVYIDKKDLNCACVGGNSNVPLGFVSVSENLMMAVMGIYLIARYAG